MNKLKLSLENFQSIKDGILEFEQGLNFIIGQSNSGKSATFRALKACLSNPSGSQRFIKKGTKKSSVLLEYNGNSIEWVRTPKDSKYCINNEEFIKTGKSNAFKLVEDTGFAKNDSDVIMNIEEELQLPFPFGLSGSDLFKLFENVFCVSDSAVILKAAKDHEAGVKSDIVLIENEISRNKLKLEELDKFSKEINLKALKAGKKFLVNKRERLNTLNEGLPEIKLAKRLSDADLTLAEENFDNKVKTLEDKKIVKDTIGFVKSAHSIEKSLKNIEVPPEQVFDKYQNKIKVKKDVAILKQLTPFSVEEISFESDMESYKDLVLLKEERDVLKEIENLSVEETSFSDTLEGYNDLINLKNEIETIKKISKIKLEIQEFQNALQNLEELKKYKMGLLDLYNDIKNKEQNEITEREKIKKLEKKLSNFKVCPLCKREM